ncbi:uncharacterized protein SCHCODRAFT_02677619 [Schizophyllum commune H4-8]|uniref:Uncharacterized protein n=1 Tax=Schizophyllum commune (strain H4-8 / FGSC 9210) TaxID=578458 RepID=D8PQG5_SCHCM|nr:uncharacterized protein SCHCODRAFT_02677619 [Schizophyllum commune H4-8]KAI5893603.1 hypothetical protein SCHCODRAFT_02677619 [Schizophyllum commune H4-8]
MPLHFTVFDLEFQFTFEPYKIKRATKAKAAQYPPSTYPAFHHPCTATNCTYANPPSCTAGTFRCRGAPEGPFTCTGYYHVSERKARANRAWWEARRRSALMQEARDVRTGVWEEQMLEWRRELEGRERYERERAEAEAREGARAAARMERQRASPTSRPRGPRARSPAICEDRSAGQSSRRSPTAGRERSSPSGTRASPSSARRWAVQNA